ncbi:MAG: DUF4142 domain-containing protein, partial [Proteobacteria bacterium]|nr:DUF4142 domain-containing protein [Pseudomonadota bacterium]
MSPTKSLIVAAVVAALSASCTPADDATTDTAVTTTPDITTPATTPGTTRDPVMGDTAQANQGEAVAMLVAVNEHEIAAAEQARDKNVTGEVREYADMLHRDHTQNLERTRELANSAGMQTSGAQPGMSGNESQMVQSMIDKSRQERERLAEMEGDAYRKAFLDMMVRDHTEAVAMIDDRMMAAATDDSFRQHL